MTLPSRAPTRTSPIRTIQRTLQNPCIDLIPQLVSHTTINHSHNHVRRIHNIPRPIRRKQWPLHITRIRRARRRHHRPQPDQLRANRLLRSVEVAVPIWERELINVSKHERDFRSVRRAEEREDLWGDALLPGARWSVVECVGVHRDVVLVATSAPRWAGHLYA
jgi:hypothetical protein